MATPKTERVEELNPRWVKESDTILKAANQAAHRNAWLKVSWSPSLGVRVVAVPR